MQNLFNGVCGYTMNEHKHNNYLPALCNNKIVTHFTVNTINNNDNVIYLFYGGSRCIKNR